MTQPTAVPSTDDGQWASGQGPSVEIALATHNGAPYLGALLDSLFAQTYQGFRVVIADDASGDGTLAILEAFQQRYPDRLRIVGFDQHSGGAAANFARLTDHLRADYVFYCDQDDVWLPDKVAMVLERMQSAERLYGAGCPCLVHTDLALVDAQLRRLHASFWRFIGINPEAISLRRVVIEFCVAGCTMGVNRALYERARPFPPGAVMHDHWLTLVAAAFGRIEFIPVASVLYRQHGGNVGQRRRRDLIGFCKRAAQYLAIQTLRSERAALELHIRQAAVFLERYGPALGAHERARVETFAGLSKMRRRYRVWNLLRAGIWRSNMASNAALFYVLSRLV